MDNSYTPPSTQPAAGIVPVLEPKAIKIFGILHVIFGIFGAFAFLSSAVQLLMGDVLIKLQSGGDEDLFQLQKGMQDQLRSTTIITLVLSLVVTILILRAGIQLLRKKRTAAKASTMYSLVAIGVNVIALVLTLIYTIPALNGYFDDFVEKVGGGVSNPQLESIMGWVKTIIGIGGVILPFLYSIYPVLSLVVLKKKNVTDFLDQNGK